MKRPTILPLWQWFFACSLLLGLLGFPIAVQAQSFTDFEPAGFVPGVSVNDIAPDGSGPVGIRATNQCVQAWWVPTAGTDEEVVDTLTAEHGKVWRLSQAVDSGTLGGNPHAPNSGLVIPFTAGETGAINDAGCGAPTSDRFYGQVEFRSATGSPEADLKIGISANSADQRHGFVFIFDDGAGAMDLEFFDTEDGCTFTSTVIDADLSYTDWHTLGIEIFFVDGLAAGTAGSAGAFGNDLVNIYVDDTLVASGTSWESCVGAQSVDRLLFETRNESVSHLGKGLYFDNVLVTASRPLPALEEAAYLPNRGDGTVSVFDSTTNNVVGTIPVGAAPTSAVVNHAGTRVYVVNTNGDSVSVIDTSMNTVVATVAVGDAPIEAAVLPDDSEVYVANRASNTVSVIDTSTNTVTDTIAAGARPHGIVEDPSGDTVYVMSRNTGEVLFIDTTTKTVADSVAVGSRPLFAAVVRQEVGDPLLYVSNSSSGTVSVVNTGTATETDTITVGTRPTGVGARRAIQENPAGDFEDRVYVANEGGGTVSVIDVSTNTVSGTTVVTSRPYGVAVDPDGLKVYVGDLLGTQISVLETFGDTLNTLVTVGNDPLAIGRYFTPQVADLITGTVSGVSVSQVKCHNLITGQKVNVQTSATTFDCEDLGLTVSTGDKLRIEVIGESDGGAFTGSLTGATPYEIFCRNTDTLAASRCKFGSGCLPPEAWTCGSALHDLPNGTQAGGGFSAAASDRIWVRLFGTVD